MGNDINHPGPEYRRMEPLKAALVAVGSHCNAKAVHLLSAAVNYVEVGYWMKSHGFRATHPVQKRRELFHLIADRVGDTKVLYLEFGVAKGTSLRYWSNLLSNPTSALHGFDTFEGLPEKWRLADNKGAYSAGGNPPEISDKRVRFFKGLFQETLPDYSPPDHDNLIINIDCDLYSSASFVLNCLAEYIRPGTFVYFDEFSDPQNELRAFQELLARTSKRFHLLGATRSYAQVSFECV